eukprot:g9866.t1
MLSSTSFKMPALKQQLEQKGLKKTGAKAELIARLLEAETLSEQNGPTTHKRPRGIFAPTLIQKRR